MVVSCSVSGCVNRRQKGSNVHFFSFPLKNPERNQLWITAIRRKGFVPTKNSCICSEHFVQSDYDLKPGGSYKLYLKETAIPSMIPDPKIKSKVIRMSIEEVLTSAEDADLSVAEDHDQKLDRENTSELIDNTQILPDSQDRETVLDKVLGETLYTPNQWIPFTKTCVIIGTHNTNTILSMI
ncbi:THAP domain-containing protein 1-like [Myzus persicae]|uniref:THAP domain-containing protein 1-like n=1 Tax=Myzus persicae TaxID=13164 RepID=UPI000B933F2B|nr:THAP domain-containing protein 1-like [Myzus persicae]